MDRTKALSIFKKLTDISDKFYLAGSVRRGKEQDIHDLDVIFTGDKLPDIFKDISFIKGPKIVRITMMDEMVDIYLTDPEYLGAMMLFLIGPQQYNIIMRAKAKRKGYKLNQYGLFNRETNELIASKTEEEIYNALDIKYKEPELRKVK